MNKFSVRLSPLPHAPPPSPSPLLPYLWCLFVLPENAAKFMNCNDERWNAAQPIQFQFQIAAVARRARRCHSLHIKQATGSKQQAVGGRQGWQSQRRHFIRAGRAKKLIDPWSATEWGRQAGPAWIPCSLQPAALPGRRELALWRHHRKGGVAVSRSTRALKQFKIPKRPNRLRCCTVVRGLSELII